MIPIRVPLKDGHPKRTIIAVVEFAGHSIKARQTDEVKSVMDSCSTDCVEPAEIDVVRAGKEIGDAVVLAARGRAVAQQEHERVGAATAGQRVDAGAADQFVVSGAADQRVVASAARQRGARIACDQRVAAAAADGLLDGRVERDPDIVDEAADRGKGARVQVDGLRRRIAGAVERVVAAAVIDRQRRRRAVVAEIEYGARIAVKAIDGIACSRRGRRARRSNPPRRCPPSAA